MYPNCGRYLHTFSFGGKGIRTPDLLIANETLYQLSYTPELFRLPRFNLQNLDCVSTGGPPVLPHPTVLKNRAPRHRCHLAALISLSRFFCLSLSFSLALSLSPFQ